MKLAKALKSKNQIAGEVARLKELLAKQNVRSVKQPFDYNNAEVLASLRGKIDELVKIKAAIAMANVEVYDKIFRMAELKGLVATLGSLETRHGVFYERGSGYGEQPVAVEYAAQIKAVEVDKMAAELKTEIQSLQDSLDEFNYTHSAAL